jgi:hypothetical protein
VSSITVSPAFAAGLLMAGVGLLLVSGACSTLNAYFNRIAPE